MSFDLSNLKLLIAEDSPHMRGLVRRILYAFDIHDVRETKDGSSAIEECKTRPPDIAVVDFAMEPLDGIAFTHYMRGNESPNPYLPIIMMTGYTEMHRIVEARDAGVTEIVAKPVSAMSLYSRLVAVIDKPRPFVRAPNFFGPDRRRRQLPFKGADRRDRDDAIEL